MATPQTKTSIALYNGDFFDFKNPENHEFDIEVIAHALSNICRFTGHTVRHYSVAEHSVLVSRLVSPSSALEGLLHDAAEAYIGDVSSPLKAMLPEYRAIETEVEKAIAKYFNLRFPLSPEVKIADKSLYRQELRQMTNGHDDIWSTDLKEANVVVAGLRAKDAKKFFLSRFEELTANRRKEETLSDGDKQVRRQRTT